MTAVGVNGLLMTSSEIFVTCALTRRAASLKTCRGFGGLGMRSVVFGALSAREAVNWARTAWVDVMRVLRALRSAEEEGAMAAVFCEECFLWFKA